MCFCTSYPYLRLSMCFSPQPPSLSSTHTFYCLMFICAFFSPLYDFKGNLVLFAAQNSLKNSYSHHITCIFCMPHTDNSVWVLVYFNIMNEKKIRFVHVALLFIARLSNGRTCSTRLSLFFGLIHCVYWMFYIIKMTCNDSHSKAGDNHFRCNFNHRTNNWIKT